MAENVSLRCAMIISIAMWWWWFADGYYMAGGYTERRKILCKDAKSILSSSSGIGSRNTPRGTIRISRGLIISGNICSAIDHAQSDESNQFVWGIEAVSQIAIISARALCEGRFKIFLGEVMACKNGIKMISMVYKHETSAVA